MKKKYVRRTRSEWEKLVRKQQESGQTIEVFCQSNGVSKSAMHYWRKKLKQGQEPKKGFVAVVPKPVSSSKILLRGRRGVEIELPLDVSTERMRELITALSC